MKEDLRSFWGFPGLWSPLSGSDLVPLRLLSLLRVTTKQESFENVFRFQNKES